MKEQLRSDEADPMMRWKLLQRGLWVHGKETLFDYFAEMMRYELSSVAGNITCPTLLTTAEEIRSPRGRRSCWTPSPRSGRR